MLLDNDSGGKRGEKTKRPYQKIRGTRWPERLLAVQSRKKVCSKKTEPLVRVHFWAFWCLLAGRQIGVVEHAADPMIQPGVSQAGRKPDCLAAHRVSFGVV
jgi:hypothetical protein